MGFNCDYTLENVANSSCWGSYELIERMFFQRSKTGMTIANAKLEATWISLINKAADDDDKLFIPFPNRTVDSTPTAGDPEIIEFTNGVKKVARKGEVSYEFILSGLNFAQMNKIKSYHGAELYAWAVTKEYIVAEADGDTSIKPFPVTIITSEPMSSPDKSKTWQIKMTVNFINTENYFTAAVLPTDFVAVELEGQKDIVPAIVSSDISDGNVKFTVSGPDGEPIVNMTTPTDWIVRVKSTQAALTNSTLTVSNGIYTLATATLTAVAHELIFKNQPSATVKGYNQKTAIEFTPVA